MELGCYLGLDGMHQVGALLLGAKSCSLAMYLDFERREPYNVVSVTLASYCAVACENILV